MLPAGDAIEAAALEAWPGLEVERDGRWVLRASNGYSKRANSVQSLAATDDENAAARLDYAKSWFKARNLPAIFRQTPLAGRKTVAALDAAKWEAHDESFVLATEIGLTSPDARVQVTPLLDPVFGVAQQTLQGYDDETIRKLGALLWTIAVPAAGLVISSEDRPLSAALVAVSGGIAYVGNVVTAKDARGHGFAHAVVQTALAWGQSQGASASALNVQADNQAALRLYQRLGYRYVHDYCYRKAPA